MNGNGNSGNRPVFGSDSSDELRGTAGADQLFGMGGDDTLSGGAGADVYNGGAGNDTYILSDDGEVDTLYFRTDSYQQDTLDLSNLLSDSVDASNLQSYLKVSDKGVYLDSSGQGQFSTEGQIARFAANNPPFNAIIAVQIADTSIIQFDRSVTANTLLIDETASEIEVESTTVGTAAGEDLMGTAYSDTLNGLGGDDTLNGGAGADTYIGGEGNDTYVLANTDAVDELAFISNEQQQDVIDVSALLPSGVTAENLKNYLKVTMDGVYVNAEGTGEFSSSDLIAVFSAGSDFSGNISVKVDSGLTLLFDWLETAGVDLMDGSPFESAATLSSQYIEKDDGRGYLNSQAGQRFHFKLDEMGISQAFGGAGDELLDASSIAVRGVPQDENRADHAMFVHAGQGQDTIRGNEDGGYYDAGQGNDRIEAGAGRNFLVGGAGDDEFALTFESSAEQLKSDLIYDFTSNSEQRDVLDLNGVLPESANASNLHNYVKVTEAGVYIDLTGSANFLESNNLVRFGEKSSLDNLVRIKFGDNDGVELNRDEAVTEIVGTAAVDSLKGADGTDTLRGNAGDDVLDGDVLSNTSSADHLYGGEGNDTIYADKLDFEQGTVDGGSGYDRAVVREGAGADVSVNLSASNLERVDGGDSNDTLDASGYGSASGAHLESGEFVVGAAQEVILRGRGGNDTLTGGAGDDYIDGGIGDDVLSGGEGKDFISGGSGDDRIVLSDEQSLDTIWDFKASGDEYDVLDITALTDDGFDPSRLADFFHVDNDYVYFDTSGTGTFTVSEAVAKLGGASVIDNEYLKVEVGGTRIGYNPVTKAVTYVNTGGPDASAAGLTVAEDSAAGTVVGQASYVDPDGVEPVEYIIAGGNDQGFFAIDASTGQVTLTEAGALGIDFENATSHSLQIVASDRDFSSNPVELVINLADVNDEAPVVSVSSSPIDENSSAGTVMGQVSAADADSTGESLTYAIAGGNDQGYFAIDSATGEVTLTASGAANFDFEAASSHTLSVTASDGTHTSTAVDFTIQLNNLNDEAPEVGSALDRIVQEDLSITVSEADLLESASDADGSALSVSNVVVASGQVSLVDNGDSTWTITPEGNWAGNSQLTFDVSDGSQTAQGQLNLAVSADADNPEFNASTATVLSRMDFETGQLAEGWTSENGAEIRMNSGYATPVEGEWAAELDTNTNFDAYHYTVDTSEGGDHQVGLWLKDRGTGSADVEIVWNGEVLEVINPDTTYGEYMVMLPDTGQASTQLTIREAVGQNDGHGPILDLITVARHDGAVVSIADEYDKIIASQEDKAFTLDMSVALTDSDGSESLAVSLAGVPAGFTVSDGSNTVLTDGSAVDVSDWSLSAVTFTPADNYNADFDMVVTATATDGSDSATAREIIRVDMQAVAESAVVSGADTGTVYEDAGATLVKSGTLTVVDADAGEGAFIAETVSGDYGSVSINANGYWVYSADNTQSAIQALGQSETLSDTVTIQTADGTTHDITITIQGNNDAPKVDVDSAVLSLGTDEDVSLTITKADFLTNIIHAEGSDSLSITDISVEQGKVLVTDNNDGTWTLTSDPNWSGMGKISYTVTDGEKAVRTRGEIEVRSVDDRPELVNPLDNQSVDENAAFSWQLPEDTFTDGDGDQLAYSATLSDGSDLPAWLSFNADTRTFSGTPDDPDIGVIQVKITASDGALSSSQDVSITVNSVNDLPEMIIAARGADAAVQLNATSEGSQEDVDIAVRPDGSLVAVWADISGDEHRIIGRFFDSDSQPAGEEFVIDSGSDFAHEPKVSVGDDGSFTVAWSDGVAGVKGAVEARSYSADGTALTDAKTAVSGNTYLPEVLALEGGDYVVATFDSWHGKRTEIQIYDNQGAPKTGVITTGAISGWDDIDYELVGLSNGNWGHAVRNNYSGEIRFNIFETSGDHVTELTINNSEAGFDIASLADGNVAMVYRDQGTVKLNKYFTDGSTNGGAIDLGISAASDLVVEALSDGGFFVGWKEADGLFGQRFLADGTSAGGRVTLSEDSNAAELSMVEMTDGSLKLAWHTTDIDGDSNAVVASKLVLPVDDLANGTVVAMVSATDEDLGDTLTYSLSNDAGGRYAIDESTGEITVADAALIDYAQSSSHTLTVAVSDGTETVTMDYTIYNNNNNLAPETADSSVTGSEDISYVFSESDFPIVDPNASDYISEIRIESLPDVGNLTLGGAALAIGDTVSAEDIRAGNLQFTGDVNESGSDYASFNFNVADRMGLYSTTEKNMTVNLSAVNDAAVAGEVSLQGSEDTVLTFTRADLLAGATDVEGDALSVADVSYTGSDGTLTQVETMVFGDDGANQINVSEKMQSMDAFSIGFEYTSTGDHPGGIDAVVSMATPGNPNSLLLETVNSDGSLSVWIHGSRTRFTEINLHDGETHNVTLTWDNTTGDLKLYDNNQLLGTQTLSQGTTIPADGWLVVGQEQDSYGGGFHPVQSLINAEIGHVTLAYDAVSQSDVEAGLSIAEASNNLAINLEAVNGEVVDTTDNHTFTTDGSVTSATHYAFTPAENFAGDVALDYVLSDGTDTTAAQATLSFSGVADAAVISEALGANTDVVAAFNMDSNSDISGNNHNANFGNGAVFADGAVQLNGAGGNLGALQMGGAITIATTFTYDSYHGWARIIDFGNGPAADNIVMGTTSEGAITVHIYHGRGNVKSLTVNNFYELGEEFHIALTIDDNGHMRLYKDGVLMGEKVDGHTPNDLVRTSTLVGESNWGEANTNGSMSDLILLNHSLDADGVAELYQSVSSGDFSSYSERVVDNAVTEDSAASLTTSGKLLVDDPDAGESLFMAETVTGTYGALVINAEGSWTYTADSSQSAIQILSDGDSLTENITVQSVDGTTKDIVITINGTNDAPVVGAIDLGSVDEDTSITITAADLLANASDVEGHSLSISGLSVDDSAHGSVISNGDGTWTFNPAANFNGNDVQLTFEVSDGTTTTSATALVDLTAVNDAPDAANVVIQGAENRTLSFTKDQLLAGATDAESDAVAIGNITYDGSDGSLAEVGKMVFGTDTDNQINVSDKMQSMNAFSLGLEYTSTGSHTGGTDTLMSVSTQSNHNSLTLESMNSDGSLSVWLYGSRTIFSEINLNDGAGYPQPDPYLGQHNGSPQTVRQ